MRVESLFLTSVYALGMILGDNRPKLSLNEVGSKVTEHRRSYLVFHAQGHDLTPQQVLAFAHTDP